MNRLNETMKDLYERIDLYKIVKNLSEKYQFEDRLYSYSNEKILDLIEALGYNAKFIKKENFFKIIEKRNNYDFYFHLSLKYGLVEIMFGTIDKTKRHISGGAISTICKLIEIENGIDDNGYLKYPNFRDYDDLTEILKVYFNLYEGYKMNFPDDY
ncbi:hypothetical protein [Sphingobacterium sp. xlx-130]|uniref:hypothetical protein n=1 Tax=Sphingobacterium sp. xlx-130 TaxID=2654323 RepID=UPI0013DA7A71|nr:hypothetical protein [Sphingobacterium sp. xlx-130]